MGNRRASLKEDLNERLLAKWNRGSVVGQCRQTQIPDLSQRHRSLATTSPARMSSTAPLGREKSWNGRTEIQGEAG